jgi:hypothetical protein
MSQFWEYPGDHGRVTEQLPTRSPRIHPGNVCGDASKQLCAPDRSGSATAIAPHLARPTAPFRAEKNITERSTQRIPPVARASPDAPGLRLKTGKGNAGSESFGK